MKHDDFMAIALDMARLGLGRTSPNPSVGAVLVKEGKILATGFHKKAGGPHAEIEALKALKAHGLQSKGATLYVTLEPCCHTARTPPCTEAILKSGIREVVIGMRDPDPRVSGRGIKILKKNGIKVREGFLRRECEELNEDYIKHRKTGRPFVILKMAMTLDGMVTTRTDESRWITGPESRNMVHEMRNRMDGILVGVNTVLKDDPQLTTRIPGQKGRDPVRIILDSRLRIPLTSAILNNQSRAPTWIATLQRPNHPRVAALKRLDAQVLFCRESKTHVSLEDLMDQLGAHGLMNLLVEGGPTVASSFLEKKLVDRVILFFAPKFLGRTLTEVTCRKVGADLMMEGRVSET